MDNAAIRALWPRAAALAILLVQAATVGATSVTVVDQHGEPVADAVVTLAPAHPAEAATEAEPAVAEMRQQGQAFLPHVIVVPRGSAVRFPNLDDTQHHVYSFSPAKVFELPLFKGDEPPPVTFDQPGVVAVGCNIHDHMRGFIIVTDALLHGVTDQNGRVTFDSAQPGTYRLNLWHERASGPFDEESVAIAAPSDAEVQRTLPLDPPPKPVTRGLRAWTER